MNDLLKQNRVLVGLLLSLGSELVTGALLWLGLFIAHQPVESHIRWFGICFVPPLLILRHFAKKKQDTQIVKTMIIALFVTFIIFLYILFKTKAIAL